MLNQLYMTLKPAKALIIALFALLFLAKSFVPLGFMPSFSAKDNVSAITICSGVDSIQIFVDENGQKVPAPNSTHDNSQICEFSLASIFSSVTAPDFEPFYVSFYERPQHTQDDITSLTVAHNFQARAPPLSLLI